MSKNGNKNVGKLLEIKGVVVDAVFPGTLPAIYSALRISRADGSDLIAEVQQHLGDDRVRAVAMDATDARPSNGSRSCSPSRLSLPPCSGSRSWP